MRDNSTLGIINGIQICAYTSNAPYGAENQILYAESINRNIVKIPLYCDLSYHNFIIPSGVNVVFLGGVKLDNAVITLDGDSKMYCHGNISGKYSLVGTGSIVCKHTDAYSITGKRLRDWDDNHNESKNDLPPIPLAPILGGDDDYDSPALRWDDLAAHHPSLYQEYLELKGSETKSTMDDVFGEVFDYIAEIW